MPAFGVAVESPKKIETASVRDPQKCNEETCEGRGEGVFLEVARACKIQCAEHLRVPARRRERPSLSWTRKLTYHGMSRTSKFRSGWSRSTPSWSRAGRMWLGRFWSACGRTPR